MNVITINKAPIKIFIDIDGVCAFWEKAVAQTFKIDIDDPEIRKSIKDDHYKIEELCGGTAKMWEGIDKEGIEWWENIELLPWAKRLYKKCKSMSDNVAFLTSPSDNYLCAAGKVKWIKKHFKTQNFIITPKKYFCASKDSLLIDDTKKKIKSFKEHGGHAVLWPDPLAILDGDIDIEDVFTDLHNFVLKLNNGYHKI